MVRRVVLKRKMRLLKKFLIFVLKRKSLVVKLVVYRVLGFVGFFRFF